MLRGRAAHPRPAPPDPLGRRGATDSPVRCARSAPHPGGVVAPTPPAGAPGSVAAAQPRSHQHSSLCRLGRKCRDSRLIFLLLRAGCRAHASLNPCQLGRVGLGPGAYVFFSFGQMTFVGEGVIPCDAARGSLNLAPAVSRRGCCIARRDRTGRALPAESCRPAGWGPTMLRVVGSRGSGKTAPPHPDPRGAILP